MKYRVTPDVTRHDHLGALVAAAVAQHPSQLALIAASRRREVERITFSAFGQTARRVAARLEDLGLQPGDRVAILMSNQPRWLLTAAAVLMRGLVLVPLDPKLTPAEHAALIAHAQPKLLVAEHGMARLLPDDLACSHRWLSEAPGSAELPPEQRWETLPDREGALVARTRDDLATIVYSSGTGGRAKGCMLTHGAYLSQLDALLERLPMAPGDRYFSILPTNHAIDFMVGFLGPLTCGATVVHQRTLRPELLKWTMQRYGITHMSVVPLLLTAFERSVRDAIAALPGWKRAAIEGLIGVNARLTERTPNHALSRRLLAPLHAAFGGQLRLLICGGAFTDRRQAEFFYRLGIPVVIGYGLTEACTVVTVNGLAPFRADSVGAPLSGTTVRIAARDATGVGEVCVQGPTLMQGYLDDPELTAQTLRDGWLYTGDLGWIDASDHLHLVGRTKDVIVTAGGKNVYPEDVEHAFAAVAAEEVAVFAANTLWPSRSLGDEELVAVVRSLEGAALPLTEVARCNRALPDYKRLAGVVPWSDAFPRTASMKLKRGELADQVGAAAGREIIERL